MQQEDSKRISSLKKPDGEKYSRITITLPPGLYQEAKSRCNDTGLSLSTVIGDLLTVWIKGGLPTPMHTSINQYTPGDNERLTYLEERVKAISDKIESPIHTDTNQYAQDITDIRARLEALEQVPLIATKAKENQHSLCQKSDKPTIDTKKELAKVAGVSHDTLALDERDMLIQKVTELERGGMGVMKIAQAIGIAHGQISKLKNRNKYPDVNLKPEQISALMSLPSQKSSPEGT